MAGALLAALRSKGVVADELRGFARAMRKLARRPDDAGGPARHRHRRHRRRRLGQPQHLDRHGAARRRLRRCPSSSTATARSRAAPAAPTCSRRWASSCRSTSSGAAACLEATGFTFLFAPYYHPAMKAVAPVRAALGVRTVFNILGPLSNPAQPPFHVLGAFSLRRREADGGDARRASPSSARS